MSFCNTNDALASNQYMYGVLVWQTEALIYKIFTIVQALLFCESLTTILLKQF